MLRDLINENEAIEKILDVHRKLNNHPGIQKTYEIMKQTYFFPNLKPIISNIINNCEICQISKPENHPVRLPFEKTDTPKKPMVHFHMDLWEPDSNERYLTCIDKFSKYASAEQIPDKNQLTIMNAMLKTFNHMGKPELITVDNESALQTEFYKEFLRENNIQIHFSTPYRKTGNSDVEKLHATLNSQITLLKETKKQNQRLYWTDPTHMAVYYYNNLLHGTTKYKPVDVHFHKCQDKFEEIFNKIEQTKEKVLNYRNKNRKDRPINQELLKTTGIYAHKTKPRYKRIQTNQIIESKKYQDNQNDKIYHKDQFKPKRKTNYNVLLSNVNPPVNINVDANDYDPGEGTSNATING